MSAKTIHISTEKASPKSRVICNTLTSQNDVRTLQTLSPDSISPDSISPDLISRHSFHTCLYQFWFRSQGLWISDRLKMTVRLLHSSELSPIRQRHELDTEFGIRTSWEYRNKAGQTVWAVAANYPSLIFTDKCSDNHSPQILGYQMVNDHQLVIAADRYEETFRLEEDNRRLRELRFVGKLIQRIWEDRFEP